MREATQEFIALWSRARAVGLTHKRVAERLGIHPSTFFNYTSGRTDASLTLHRNFERLVSEAESATEDFPLDRQAFDEPPRLDRRKTKKSLFERSADAQAISDRAMARIERQKASKAAAK